MLRRFFPCVALLGLVALPSAARPAEEKKPAAPALVLRVESFDEVVASVRYLAALIGQDEQAKQIEGLIKAKGLDGVDTKRPIAVYGHFTGDIQQSTAVLLVPISDEKAFLGLLENNNIKPEKGDDGVYEIKAEGLPAPVFFRFAHKHAYITAQNKEAIAKDKIVAPAVVLPAARQGLISLSLRIDQIPDDLRRLAIAQMEAQLASAKEEKLPDETEAQKALKGEIIDEFGRQIKAVLEEGGELALRFDVDRKAGDVSLELALRAKDGSPLAKNIAELGKAKSTVAGLVAADSAMNVVVNLSLPEKLRKPLSPVIDEMFAKALEEEKDKAKREVAEKMLKALSPTFKVGELDMAIDFRGPSKDKKYTLVAAQKVSDGAAIEKALREMVKTLPEAEQKEFAFDVEKFGDIAIHRMKIKDADEEFKKAFGEEVAYMAVRSDAMFLALGDGALAALKDALKVGPKVGRPVQFQLAVGRLAETMAKERPNAPKAAEKAFAAAKDSDRITFSLEAGKELKLRINMKAQVLQFFQLLEGSTAG